jgi:hypothetical protein
MVISDACPAKELFAFQAEGSRRVGAVQRLWFSVLCLMKVGAPAGVIVHALVAVER